MTGNIKEQANKVFEELAKDPKSGITTTLQEGYRYWSNQYIKEELGIEGVEQDFFVNVKQRSVISYQGMQYEEKTYYTLNQLPNGLYNVEYEKTNSGKPTFTISQEKIGEGKWKITISNISYEEGYIDKWQVKYQLQGKDNWKTSENLNFVINAPGRYTIMITNGEIESETQVIWIDSWWDEEAQVNVPNLSEDMVAVYWDTSGNEITKETIATQEEWNNWYQYVAGDNQTDTQESRWANAKTNDGSYWVWIPRYEYKILSGEGTSDAGKIEVKFISTSQTTPDEGYKIHPAFTDGTKNYFKNGEWDRELAGIWVAKYEMSMEINGTATTTSEANIGNVLTNDQIKMVSKPEVSSWRNINASNSYTNAYQYDRKKESHLMKNSEWGAVAYLTHSQYGRNGNEITINADSSYITGSGGDTASSTGNIYGIYDLSGGAWERMAAYLINGNAELTTNGASFTEATLDPEGYKTKSTKYATVYPHDTSTDDSQKNYIAYKNAGYGYGDAILETSTEGEYSTSTSWFNDDSVFLCFDSTFFYRGGFYNIGTRSGIFAFNRSAGISHEMFSFRVVIVI